MSLDNFMPDAPAPGILAPAGPAPGVELPSTANYTGGEVDPATFWSQPATAAVPANPAPAAPAPTLDSGTVNPLQSVIDRVNNATTASFMDKDVVAEMGENKFEKFNTGLQNHARDILRQGTELQIDVLKQVIPQMFERIEQLMEARFSSNDKSAFLESNVKAAADPATKAMTQRIFEQAMKIHQNDRTKALATTKQMLVATREAINNDMPLDTPPGNPANRGPKVDWADELGITGMLSRT